MKKKEEETRIKVEKMEFAKVVEWMIDDYEKQGDTFTLFWDKLGPISDKGRELIADVPISILLANFTTNGDEQRAYVQHLQCCNILYLDAYKILNCFLKIFPKLEAKLKAI